MIALYLLLSAAAQAAAASLPGSWTNQSRSVIVLIEPCGENALCGTVQWASAKAQADARRGGTVNLVGTELLGGFVPVAPGRWEGILFVPDLNKRSKAELQQLDDDRIRVRGCAVAHLLCKSQIWTRHTDNRDGDRQ